MKEARRLPARVGGLVTKSETPEADEWGRRGRLRWRAPPDRAQRGLSRLPGGQFGRRRAAGQTGSSA